tara:strand:- start:2853 stop:3035 length:183 start_codon:yes stop_codon:yes gene_type:complete
MDKWKVLLYKQVKLREHLIKKGIDPDDSPDPTLYEEVCKTMTDMGYDVPKLVKQAKMRLN